MEGSAVAKEPSIFRVACHSIEILVCAGIAILQ
jgi:hypothetical protein